MMAYFRALNRVGSGLRQAALTPRYAEDEKEKLDSA